MPKKISNALTPLQVKSAGPGRHSDGGGLQLLVKPSGAKSWVYRFMLRGKSRDIGLGAAAGPGALTLAQARTDAEELRKLVKAGTDPLEKRDQDRAKEVADAQAAVIAGITFRQSAEAYVEAHEEGWRNDKHRAQWRSTLKAYVYPKIGDIAVADVDTSHVMSVLEPIWRKKPETASRIRGRMETILDAARARGHRSGENPARWRGHISQMLPKRKLLSRGHHKALPYAELPAFMTELREKEAVAASALEFAILTAARSGEVLGARWEEFDLASAVWTVPAGRMKAGKEHRVPLSPRAVQIVQDMKPLGKEWVFPGTKGSTLSGMAMAMILRRSRPGFTVHGFRSSFRDWAAEQTSFAHEVCEMALAHAIGNKAEAAYRRGDLFTKRRKLMEAWAAYCDRPAPAKVVPIRRAGE